jgi:hypothetical protein
MDPTFLTSAVNGGKWSLSSISHFTWERALVPIKQEAGWVPDLVWILLCNKNNLFNSKLPKS